MPDNSIVWAEIWTQLKRTTHGQSRQNDQQIAFQMPSIPSIGIHRSAHPNEIEVLLLIMPSIALDFGSAIIDDVLGQGLKHGLGGRQQ